jgi:phosphate-selective porin
VKNNLDQSVNRFQLAAGWFLIEQVVVKLEYVKQNYNEFLTAYGKDAGFNGVMFEAAISF